MPRLKARNESALRDALTANLARAVSTWEQRGEGWSLDDWRERLALLTDGEPVTVPAWELGAALADAGAPAALVRDVLTGFTSFYVVDPAGGFTPTMRGETPNDR